MAAFLLLAVQTASGAAATADAAPIQVEFDLARVARDERCGGPEEGGDAAIVVCGRPNRLRPEFPMEEMERRYGARPIVAETSIGGRASVRAFTESVDMGQGQISNRAMVGVRLPF